MEDALDFWLGRWTVRTADGAVAGSNHVERSIGGVVLEHWRSADGSRGESFFYYDPSARLWRQVWVGVGHYKEKVLVERTAGSVRFQGVVHGDGIRYPDRTTLTARIDGSVHQLIEHSLDGGLTWETGFDAVYVLAEG